jgi:Tol biopolymer transport system component
MYGTSSVRSITFSRARARAIVTFALLLGGCAGSGPTPSRVADSPAASAPSATAVVPSAAASESHAAPICLEGTPGWVAAAQHAKDNVPDPAGRIVFGQLHRGDEVIGQVIAPLFSMDADGSDVRQIFNCEIERPRVSRDGSRIAFSIAMTDGSWQVATIAADGSDLRILTSTAGYAETPDWSPDGSWLVFANSDVQCSRNPMCESLHESLWRIDADGSDQRPIGSKPQPAWDWEPRISPDGTEIVFVRSTPDDGYRWHVMVRNVESGEDRPANSDMRDLEHPDWSHDGAFIVYNVTPSGPIERISATEVGSTPVVLTGDSTHGVYKPVYSRDGIGIAFGCDGAVCRMSLDGSDIIELLRVAGVEFNHFDWGPALSPD